MAGEGFTILHASDFQLDVPLGGMGWIPEAIKSDVLEAPEVAARRVFDLAIKHQVDMVALTGNLLCPAKSSARSLTFIEAQFDRMHEHGIPVIWATGARDPLGDWPSSMAWPDSLVLFDRGRVDRRLMTLGDIDIEVLGCGSDSTGKIHPKWFDGLSRGEHQLVVGGGTVDTFKNLEAAGLWLLGGRSYAEHLVDGNANLFYAGIPQGRCFADSGTRGALLIHVDDQVEFTKLDCAPIRYENINIDADSIADLGELESRIFEYLEDASLKTDCINLIQWDVNCNQTTDSFHETNTEFLQWMQKIGQQPMLTGSSIFTLGVNVHCGKDREASTEGEDLLSDYLFALQSLRENGWSKMQLIDDEGGDKSISPWMCVDENLDGLRTLDDAARLGELLLGETNSSLDSTNHSHPGSEAA